jgi:hypothetical protein
MSKYVENDVNADHERLFVSIATFLNLTCPVNYEPNLEAKTCPKIPPSQIPTRNAKKRVSNAIRPQRANLTLKIHTIQTPQDRNSRWHVPNGPQFNTYNIEFFTLITQRLIPKCKAMTTDPLLKSIVEP